MTKLQRRLLFFFFFFLFLLTVPLVILFVQGYRFDRTSGIFIYSGSISIKSWPREIEVYLNGKKYTGKKGSLINETFIINGLRPGKYRLSCRKEGYSSWEKDIEVHSGISTEFWNVLLFPLPTKMEQEKYEASQSVHRFFISPRENNELVFLKEENSKNVLKLLDLKNGQTEDIFSFSDWQLPDPQDQENVEWSSDKKALLIPVRDSSGHKEYFVGEIKKNQLFEPIRLSERFFSLTTKENIHLNKDYTSEKFKKVRWMFDKNDELVILTDKHNLFYFNIYQPEKKLLLAESVSDFDFAGNRIYYAQSPNNLVWEIKNNDVTTRRQITKTAFSAEIEGGQINLKVYDEYRLVMINSLGQIFIFNQEKEKNETLSEEMQGDFIDSQFSNDGKKLLFWSHNEIWIMFLRDWEVQPIRKKNEKKMLARFSQPLKNVQWMEDYENILFTSGNWLKSAEIDYRNKINLVDLLEKKAGWQENEVLYNKASQTLFYLDQKDNQKPVIYSSLLINKKGPFGF